MALTRTKEQPKVPMKVTMFGYAVNLGVLLFLVETLFINDDDSHFKNPLIDDVSHSYIKNLSLLAPFIFSFVYLSHIVRNRIYRKLYTTHPEEKEHIKEITVRLDPNLSKEKRNEINAKLDEFEDRLKYIDQGLVVHDRNSKLGIQLRIERRNWMKRFKNFISELNNESKIQPPQEVKEVKKVRQQFSQTYIAGPEIKSPHDEKSKMQSHQTVYTEKNEQDEIKKVKEQAAAEQLRLDAFIERKQREEIARLRKDVRPSNGISSIKQATCFMLLLDYGPKNLKDKTEKSEQEEVKIVDPLMQEKSREDVSPANETKSAPEEKQEVSKEAKPLLPVIDQPNLHSVTAVNIEAQQISHIEPEIKHPANLKVEPEKSVLEEIQKTDQITEQLTQEKPPEAVMPANETKNAAEEKQQVSEEAKPPLDQFNLPSIANRLETLFSGAHRYSASFLVARPPESDALTYKLF